MNNPNPINSRCGLEDCDCGHMIDQLNGALERLQQRFNEVWAQHQRMILALESTRDIVHRTHCPTPPSLPQKCWKECEEAMDAMLEAGWMPQGGRDEDQP